MHTYNVKPGLKLVCGLLAVACVASSSLYAAEIHVDVLGQDANPGTKSKPVATLHAAQRIARQHIANGLKQPVSILIGEGSYYLNAPLKLTPEDSGTAECPVTWRAAEGNEVLLSGGVRITGKWKKGADGIWSVKVPGVTDGWNFRQLFVDGSRAIRARFPNADEANPFLYATGGAMDHVMIDPDLVKTTWGSAPDAQINIVPKWKFFNQWNTVTGVNTSSGRIDFADSERHGPIEKNNWFWIEGVKEELDQPGEWYLDQSAGRLHYMPESGKNPNDLNFIAPFLNQIVYAKGDVNAGTHVEYVNFEGLEFRHTTFTLGHIAPRVCTDGAIIFENTCNSSVKDCHIENVGGYAFWMHLDSKRNIFDQNTVFNSGGGGVLMTGSRLSYMDDSKVYTPGEAAAKVAPILNRVTRNTVEYAGKIRYYGGGVHMDSRPFCMSMYPGNYIAHNHFNSLPRCGIFVFRNQGGHVIEYNHIHNVMMTSTDGACVHLATMNHLNAPIFVLNNWFYDIWAWIEMPDVSERFRRTGNGIGLDWASSNTTVKDNYIYNTAKGKPIDAIMGNWNITIEDNHCSKTRIVPPFVDEVGPNGTATHGIDLEKNRLTGSVVHYTDSDLVAFAGDWKPRTIAGVANLFTFHQLEVDNKEPAEISYSLPFDEDGTYQVSLLYKPTRGRNASNAKIQIHHAEGINTISWSMKRGDQYGFALEVGKYPFRKGKPAKVVISNEGANGYVVADSVAFVKVSDKLFVEDTPQDAVKTKLKGYVVDCEDSLERTGDWIVSEVAPILGEYYFHDGNNEKGSKSITLRMTLPESGRYRIKLLYKACSNRASNTPVTVTIDESHTETFRVNQKETNDEHGFVLGTFDVQQFVKVVVSNASTDGYVVVDGVQAVKE